MSQLDLIADAFLRLHQTHSPGRVPGADITSLSLDDAYTVQARVVAARVAAGERIVGYKVGCTSRAIRHQFGLREPVCGHLMDPHVHYGETELNWNDFVQCAVEPEFVLGIGADLTAEVDDPRDLLAAIEFIAPGIEVHHYKFWFGPPSSQELIASNAIHAALVVGTQRTVPQHVDLELEGVGLFQNGILAASGIGAEIMGGPLRSLAWLVNHLVRQGSGLHAGQLVIPGSAVELVPVSMGDRIRASFTRLGTVEARFVER